MNTETVDQQPQAEQPSLHETLAAARKRLGLTQEQMAERVDVSQVTISLWESGKAKPAPIKLGTIGQAYEVEVEVLTRLWMAAAAAAAAARAGAA